MKIFSPVVEQFLSSKSIALYYLVYMVVNGVSFRHCTLPYDVTINSLGTFTANNNLVKVDAPNMATTLGREAYRVTYFDPDLLLKPYFEKGAIGSPISIWVGFINTTDNELNDALPGAPLLRPADLVLFYKGILDTIGYSVAESGEVLLNIEGSSPMLNLEAKNSFLAIDSNLKLRRANDTALSELDKTSIPWIIRWGKV